MAKMITSTGPATSGANFRIEKPSKRHKVAKNEAINSA